MSDSREDRRNGYTGPDRRSQQLPTQYKRRANDKRDDFRLLRDKVLLSVGSFGVLGIALAAVTVGVKDTTVALAALGVFGGILGAPAAIRKDEQRNDRAREDA